MITDKDIKNTSNCIEKVDQNGYQKIYSLYQNKNVHFWNNNKFKIRLAIFLGIFLLFSIGVITILNINSDQVKNSPITIGDINSPTSYPGSEPLPPNYRAYNSFKCKIEIKKDIYSSNDTIYVRMYLGCLNDNMFVNDEIKLNIITEDFDYTQSDSMTSFTKMNYPLETNIFKKYNYQKYIDFEFTKKEITDDEYLDIQFLFEGEIAEDFDWEDEDYVQELKKFHLEYNLKGYESDGIMVISDSGYPIVKTNYYLYKKGIIDGKELSRRYYYNCYRNYIVIAITQYNKSQNYTIINYESKNLLIEIKIIGEHEIINQIYDASETVRNYMEKYGSFRDEYFIDMYRVVATNFIEYCYEIDLITEAEYSKEIASIMEVPRIGDSFIGYSIEENKNYYNIVQKNKRVIKNY